METFFPLGIHKHFVHLGLNETQIRILETIFALKNLSAKDLQLKTEFPKSTIIYSLNRLKELHLISSHRDGLKEYYHLETLEHLDHVLRQRAQEEINTIQGKYDHIKHFWRESSFPSSTPNLTMYQGSEDILSMYQNILENMQTQVILINGNAFNSPQVLTRSDISHLSIRPQLPFERQLFLYHNRLACIENKNNLLIGYILENTNMEDIISKLVRD